MAMEEFFDALNSVIQHVPIALDYQSFVRLGACSKSTRQVTLQHSHPLRQEHLYCWLTQLSQQGAAADAAALASLAHLARLNILRNPGYDNKRSLELLVSNVPDISMKCATALINADLCPTYQHIRAAALKGTPGLYIWSRAFHCTGIPSGFPAAVEAVCCGRDPDLTAVSQLQITGNTH
jgi:hypothetical protein